MRLSFHPTTTTADIEHAMHALREIVAHADEWAKDYVYSPVTNEFSHKDHDATASLAGIKRWFELGPQVDPEHEPAAE